MYLGLMIFAEHLFGNWRIACLSCVDWKVSACLDRLMVVSLTSGDRQPVDLKLASDTARRQ